MITRTFISSSLVALAVAGSAHAGFQVRTSNGLVVNADPGNIRVTRVHLDDNDGQRWVRFRGAIPGNAMVGGYEKGQPLFICKARYNGGMHPGKVVAGNCNISWGGKEIERPDFRVLLGSEDDFDWLRAPRGLRSADKVVGGYEDNGRPIYICQGFYNGGVHPGKVVAGNCNIGWGGQEVVLNRFKVLVAN